MKKDNKEKKDEEQKKKAIDEFLDSLDIDADLSDAELELEDGYQAY